MGYLKILYNINPQIIKRLCMKIAETRQGF